MKRLKYSALALLVASLAGCPEFAKQVISGDGAGEFGYTCAVRKHGSTDGTWSQYFKTAAERDEAAQEHEREWGAAHTTQPIG